jgi:hypothetical protein
VDAFFVDTQWETILMEDRIEAFVLPLTKTQIAKLCNHHSPAENRGQEERHEDQFALERAFGERVDNSGGDYHVVQRCPDIIPVLRSIKHS